MSDMPALKTHVLYVEVTFYFDVFTKEILAYRCGVRRGDRHQYIDGLIDVKEILKGHNQPVYLHMSVYTVRLLTTK